MLFDNGTLSLQEFLKLLCIALLIWILVLLNRIAWICFVVLNLGKRCFCFLKLFYFLIAQSKIPLHYLVTCTQGLLSNLQTTQVSYALANKHQLHEELHCPHLGFTKDFSSFFFLNFKLIYKNSKFSFIKYF